MARIQRALFSLTDKSGAVEFARGLAALGIELISTGGTAKLLRENGLAVRDISEVTGFPEMLDGRVKTIHPKVAAGILAMRARPEHMATIDAHGIEPIDMVVVNLYAFEKAAAEEGAPLEHLIENIDIGGPTMIRAAAKNYQDVAVVVSPSDYACLLEEMHANGAALSTETHWRLMRRAFALTAAYDSAITERLAQVDEPAGTLPAALNLRLPKSMALRYGENPHQAAALYSHGVEGVAGARQLQGKELSFNNLVDLDAAWHLIQEFQEPAAAIVKHTNPCGCAEQDTLVESYRKAFEADPISAFGGVLAFNRPVDEDTAREVAKTFVEAVAAPSYSPEALAVLGAKKNLRLLEVEGGIPTGLAIRSISGGILVQTADTKGLDRLSSKVVTGREPSDEEWRGLSFAWKVVKHVKSNAIVYAREGQLISAGAGQMSRVDSVRFGAMKAILPLPGAVLASDAFFPFADGLESAAQHGITAAIQPGGSVRDDEVIAAANRLGIAMVFTGVRHFRH
ncbi:MAG TPA: bifunctional phosphoribosylaminoimidazolecarboxamide formyltransferase/IMP cyclohydrolase [Bryobacteraceae bacterium]|nr:bifunctional phosphoribosylaminoimidazolecarboxamide formyltransferase/IMP cyclohydrolase [Bryobacteraceae bacterium]